MATLQVLETTVPGNIGLLVDDQTVMLFDFAEVDGVPPSDRAGTLEDLAAAVVGDEPQVDEDVRWAQTRSRRFIDRAYVADDQAGASSLLTRDVSIQAIVTLDAAGSDVVVLVRGAGGSAAQYVCYGLIVNDSLPSCTAKLFWQDLAGVTVVDTGATFPSPAAGQFVLLTATRRWESTTSVVCRYYLGDQLLGEVASADGEIGGGTTGTTSIGARMVAGVPIDFWPAHIDELKVTRHEMCLEEVRATWRRLTVHQPAGDDLMRDLTPPGAPIARDPSTRIQRLLRFIGQGLGLAVSRLEQLEDVLPDRAYGPHLERWERICTLAPGPRDSLDTRRARVLAHLRRKGWTIENVRGALLELFDLDAADIEILNFSNTFTDDFASIRAERWAATPAANWTVLGGAARVQAALLNDIRWTGAVRAGPLLLMPVHTIAELYLAAKLTLTAVPTDGEAGLYVRHGHDGSHLFFGVRNDGGTYEVVHQRFHPDPTYADPAPVVLTATTSAPHWLRLRQVAASSSTLAAWTLEWSTDGTTFDDAAVTWSLEGRWCGFYARGADSSLAGALDVRFSEFLARTPQGRRPFCVYAYRDSGLPGAPDMKGARDLLRRFRHAYVHSSAITSLSMLCDDSACPSDAGPMGGI